MGKKSSIRSISGNATMVVLLAVLTLSSCVTSSGLITQEKVSTAEGVLRYKITDTSGAVVEEGVVENGEFAYSPVVLFNMLVLRREEGQIATAVIFQGAKSNGPMNRLEAQFYFRGEYYPGKAYGTCYSWTSKRIYDKNGEELNKKNSSNPSLWTPSAFRIRESYFFNTYKTFMGRFICGLTLNDNITAKDEKSGLTFQLLKGSKYLFE